jgi:hypothetical protein
MIPVCYHDPVLLSAMGGWTIVDGTANLKFLSDSPRFRYRNVRFKAALKTINSQAPPIPKFA